MLWSHNATFQELAVTLSKHYKKALHGGETTNNGYDSGLWGEKSILAQKSTKPS